MYGRFLTIFIFLIGIWLNLIDFGSTDVAAFSHETKNEALQSKLDRLEQLFLLQNEKITELQLSNQQLQHSNAQLTARLAAIEQHQQMRPTETSSMLDAPTNLRRSADDVVYNGKAAVLPTSCVQLSLLGNTNNGLYLVQKTNRIATVFCAFNLSQINPGYETQIGYNDIKTTLVSFMVLRTTTFATTDGGVVTYDTSITNVGGAMDVLTGVFTAPTAGTYSFFFNARANTASSNAYIRVNGISQGIAWGAAAGDQMPSHATVKLEKGDRVDIFLGGGSVFDDIRHFTHFTGFLLEEDIPILQ